MNTAENNIPFLVATYFVLHPEARLTLPQLRKVARVKSKSTLRQALLNGIVEVEDRIGPRGTKVYRPGPALAKVRARVDQLAQAVAA